MKKINNYFMHWDYPFFNRYFMTSKTERIGLQRLDAYLQQLKRQGIYRQRHLLPMRDGAPIIHFSSNDYLGLAEDASLKKAYQEGYGRFACGSGASAVVSGYHPIHKQCESLLCDMFQAGDAVLFSSGYAANLSIVSLLTALQLPLFIDKKIHASWYDGIRLNQAVYHRYPHVQINASIRSQCHQYPASVMITEGIFSMSGQFAPIAAVLSLCADTASEMLCVVDEAHSFGVMGPHGLGVVAEYPAFEPYVPLRVITFGKALAGQGAAVIGDAAWIDALIQQARSYIYSTAMSPAQVYGLMHALKLVYRADEQREMLQHNIQYFNKKAAGSLFRWQLSYTPIQQLQLGCPHAAEKLSQFLIEKGIYCRAIRQPTVTRLETGLRIVLNSQHTTACIDRLFAALFQFQENFAIIPSSNTSQT